jgi:hypothetical protein
VNLVDGVVRLWREWLAEQARLFYRSAEAAKDTEEADQDIGVYSGKKNDDASKLRERDEGSGDRRILWIDEKRNVGLKVRVREHRWVSDTHILVHQDDDDVSVSYEIEFEGGNHYFIFPRLRAGQIFENCCCFQLTALQNFSFEPRGFSWRSRRPGKRNRTVQKL